YTDSSSVSLRLFSAASISSATYRSRFSIISTTGPHANFFTSAINIRKTTSMTTISTTLNPPSTQFTLSLKSLIYINDDEDESSTSSVFSSVLLHNHKCNNDSDDRKCLNQTNTNEHKHT